MNYQSPAAPKKGMPWWGILLIVFGILALLAVGVVVAVGVWLNNNKDRLVQGAQTTMAEADAFAASHEQKACVDEGLERSGKCQGIMCTAELQIFVQRCLQKATKTPTLCDGVPRPNEIMQTANWAVAECQRRGRSDQACRQLVQAVPNHCQQSHH